MWERGNTVESVVLLSRKKIKCQRTTEQGILGIELLIAECQGSLSLCRSEIIYQKIELDLS